MDRNVQSATSNGPAAGARWLTENAVTHVTRHNYPTMFKPLRLRP